MSFNDLLNQPLPSQRNKQSKSDVNFTMEDAELYLNTLENEILTENTESDGYTVETAQNILEQIETEIMQENAYLFLEEIEREVFSDDDEITLEEYIESADQILEDIDDLYFSEGANLDIRSKYKNSKKSFKEMTKEIKSLMKAGKLDEAGAKIDEAEKVVDTAIAEVKAIKSTENEALIGGYFGFAVDGLKTLLLSIPTLGIYDAVQTDKKRMRTKAKNLENKANPGEKGPDDFNSYKTQTLGALKDLKAKLGKLRRNLNKMKGEATTESCDTEGCCGREACGEEGCCGREDVDFDVTGSEDDSDVDEIDISDIDNFNFNLDDLDDSELAELDAEFSGEDDGEETLTPEEEIQADDMMSAAATTMLVNDELNAQEKAAFIQSEREVAIVINEGFMTEADINQIAYEQGLITEGKYNKKMIIRLDAEAKKKQLYALAVNVSAAAKQDPDYIKLKKVMKMRKILRAKLEKKYHSEATKRMKIYFTRLNKSRSATLNKIAQKADK